MHGRHETEPNYINTAPTTTEAAEESTKVLRAKSYLIGNSEAEGTFHRLFSVNSNVLARTKQNLERHLSKRIAQLNNDRRAESTCVKTDKYST